MPNRLGETMPKLNAEEAKQLGTLCGALWFLVVSAGRTIINTDNASKEDLADIAKASDEVTKLVSNKLGKI